MVRNAAAYADDLYEVVAEEDHVTSNVTWTPFGRRPEGQVHRTAWQERTTLALSEDPRAAAVVYDFNDEPTTRGTIEAAEEPRWLAPTVSALTSVLGLPDGWNSYGAPRIQARAAQTAFDLLRSSAQEDSPAPIVVPTAEGGVQLEWHAWGLDVEVDVSPGEAPQLFFRDRQSNEVHEQELTTNLESLYRALKVLTERAAPETRR
jgi:hypothetical protein